MVMSTRTLAEAGRLLATNFVDTLQVLEVGPPVTTGATVSRSVENLGDPVAGLVQTTVLANAAEGIAESVFAVKVARGVALGAGNAVRVLSCPAEPALVGKVLLLDKVSLNGLALIRKGVATEVEVVDQQGKQVIA